MQRFTDTYFAGKDHSLRCARSSCIFCITFTAGPLSCCVRAGTWYLGSNRTVNEPNRDTHPSRLSSPPSYFSPKPAIISPCLVLLVRQQINLMKSGCAAAECSRVVRDPLRGFRDQNE